MREAGSAQRGWPGLGLVLLAAMLAAPLAAGPAAAATATATATASFIQCDPAVDVFVWDGSAGDSPGTVGDDRNWDNGYNWDVDCTPGLKFPPAGEGYDDDVTIPAGASVFLNNGQSAHITALHSSGALTLTTGARLFTSADSESQTLTLKGLLGGTGRFTVTGQLNWVSTGSGAASQSTRECTSQCPSPLPPGGEGTTVIAPGARLNVSGAGVGLHDQRVIENHGITTLSGAGYIAADFGTAFRNLRDLGGPTPQFVIRNDGGYYEGFSYPTLDRSGFSNSGKVVKNGGQGVSVIDATFSPNDPGSPYTGTVEVRSGTLSIYEQELDESRTAKVRQGLTFGNGGCASQAQCTVLEPTTDDPQLTTVQLTQSGTTLATVSITELAIAPVAGQRGVPVEIETPNAMSSPSTPLRFRILLDASLRNPGETAQQAAQNSPVYRQETPTAPYLALPNCGPAGNPTLAKPSCVARGLSGSETAALGTGDVVLVVSSLQNSRYRVGGRVN